MMVDADLVVVGDVVVVIVATSSSRSNSSRRSGSRVLVLAVGKFKAAVVIAVRRAVFPFLVSLGNQCWSPVRCMPATQIRGPTQRLRVLGLLKLVLEPTYFFNRFFGTVSKSEQPKLIAFVEVREKWSNYEQQPCFVAACVWRTDWVPLRR